MLPDESTFTHFAPERKHIGNLPVRMTGHVQFTRAADGRHVVSVRPGCGCTEVQFTDEVIKAELMISGFPPQIEEQGKDNYTTSKHLTVVYDDQTFDTLWIDAQIYKN